MGHSLDLFFGPSLPGRHFFSKLLLITDDPIFQVEWLIATLITSLVIPLTWQGPLHKGNIGNLGFAKR